MHKVDTAVIRYREPWEQELAARAARSLGLSPTRVRTGKSRWKKETHVRGPEAAVVRWRELVAVHVAGAREAVEGAWRAYVGQHFPEEPAAQVELQSEEL